MTIAGGIANCIFEMQKTPSLIWDLESKVHFSQHLLKLKLKELNSLVQLKVN